MVVETRAGQATGRAELMLAAVAIEEIAAAPGDSDLARSVAAVLLDVAAGLRRAAMQQPASKSLHDV